MEEIQCTALVADSAEKGFDLEPRTVTRPFDPSGTDIVIKLHYSGAPFDFLSRSVRERQRTQSHVMLFCCCFHGFVRL